MMSAPARQINDIIFDILSGYYGTGRTDVQVGDLFARWLADMGLGWGDSLQAFYTAQTAINNFGDAQWTYWSELGDTFLLQDGGVFLLQDGFRLFTEDAYQFS
jgi:hypothetical protein